MILLADVRSLEDLELCSRLYNKLCEERQTATDHLRHKEDKDLSIAGGILLDLLLEQNSIHAAIAHAPDGRPFVVGHPELTVSLTHAYPYAAAILCERPCGIDLEARDRDLEAIVRRYYSEEEKAYAGSDQNRITDIWCRKECYVKWNRPAELRKMNTFAIPQDYCYLSFPVEGFSFEVLLPKGEYEFREVLLRQCAEENLR